MDIKSNIEQLKNHPHCCNCGKINPEVVAFSDNHNEEGHTQCCNEAVCRHEKLYFFGNEEIETKACCWAMADLQFRLRGIDVHLQKGMKRWTVS